jgi:putative phage-type endonuclease
MDWAGNQENKIEQGTSKWHLFRGKGIGSSDMPTIMGVSPWKTLYDLWLEKTDQLPEEKKFKGNWATRRGQELEPIAREMYEKIKQFKYPPDIGTHKTFEFMRASFDGINHGAKKVIEIKCPGKDSHDKAIAGKIPEVYWPQCQWLLLISGYDDLDYISWDGKESLIIIPIKSDKSYQAKMIVEANVFWHSVVNRTPPPQQSKNIVENENLSNLLTDRERLKTEIDALTVGFEMITGKIRKLATEPETVCGGFKIKWTEVHGAIDYLSIPEIKGIDLSQYRKPSTKRMTITKEKK